MSTICLGLSGRDLKDKDFFGKSDPYVIISRPLMGGGFAQVLKSETKQVKQDIGSYFLILIVNLLRTHLILTGMIFCSNKIS